MRITLSRKTLFQLSLLAAFVSSIIYYMMRMIKEDSSTAAKNVLPQECSHLLLAYGDIRSANLFVLGETHLIDSMSSICMYALSNILFNTKKINIYHESLDEPQTPKHYLCDQALSCISWDDKEARAELDATFGDAYHIFYSAQLQKYFQRFSTTDEEKYFVLMDTLANKTHELRDYFYTGYSPYSSEDLYAWQNDFLRHFIGLYEKQCKSLTQRNWFFDTILENIFAYLRRKTTYPGCAKKNTPDELVECHFTAAIADKQKLRDAALFRSIYSSKNISGAPTFFIAGNDHAEAVLKKLEDSKIHDREIAILTLKQ